MLSNSSLRWQARSSRLVDSPCSGSMAHLCFFPPFPFSPLVFLSWRWRRRLGERAALFVTSSPGPLPATSIHQVCPPFLFPSPVRNGAPQTLTKLFVFGSYQVLCWVRPWFDWVFFSHALKSALENVLWSFYLTVLSSPESPVLLLVSHQEFPIVFRQKICAILDGTGVAHRRSCQS
jgi:hypothetical protein